MNKKNDMQVVHPDGFKHSFTKTMWAALDEDGEFDHLDGVPTILCTRDEARLYGKPIKVTVQITEV